MNKNDKVKYCVVNQKNCPCCENTLIIDDGKCSKCNARIRKISSKRIRNNEFCEPIIEYDEMGNQLREYSDVYEIFPEDDVKARKKRDKVINVCKKNSRSYLNHIWRFANDNKIKLEEIKTGRRIKMVKVDLNGNWVEEYPSIKEAAQEIGVSIHTINNAYKKKKIIPGINAFVLPYDECCARVIDKLIYKHKSGQKKIKVIDGKGKTSYYKSFIDCAQAFGLSSTTIRKWCKNISKPSLEEYRDYVFCENTEVESIKPKCKLEVASGCEINDENTKLRKELEESNETIKKLNAKLSNMELEAEKKEKQIEKLKSNSVKYYEILDSRIPRDIDIDDFKKLIDEKGYETEPYIYILRDESGKRYVGQSTLNNFSRILDHFKKGDPKDPIYEAFISETKFFVEKIITGWRPPTFNLDVAEKSYIEKYDSKKSGYNRTEGNGSKKIEIECE